MAASVTRLLPWDRRGSTSSSISGLCPLSRGYKKPILAGSSCRRIAYKAVELESQPAAAKSGIKKSRYQLESLTTWLLKQEQAGHIDAELAVVLSSISLACKQIATLLRLVNLTGDQGTINIQGEDQKKLDVIANELFSNCLRTSGRTGIIASEEEDVPVAVEETYSGNYIMVFDPIDGSANIDTSLTTGSIFWIYAHDKQCLFDVDDNSTVNS